MIKYKMLISGSVSDKFGNRHQCNFGQIIEAKKGAFDEAYAEVVVEKKTKKKPETAQLKIDSETAEK